MSEWISVKDALPIRPNWVMVYDPESILPDFRVWPCFYDKKAGEWACGRKSITHWMPMPTPPKMCEAWYRAKMEDSDNGNSCG